MAHIHTAPNQHDQTISAYIIKLGDGEPKALLHMHRKLNRLLPFGGHVELDETVWSSVVHELREESGYTIDQLNIMQPPLRIEPEMIDEIVVHPQPFLVNTHDLSPTHFHDDIAYFFTTSEEPKHAPAEGESLDLRWLTAEEIATLPREQIFANTQIIYGRLFKDFLQAWEPVPAVKYSTGVIVAKDA